MIKPQVKIVSDGTAIGTKVFVDGIQLPNVTRIEFDPMVPFQPISCKISLFDVACDVVLEAKGKDE